MNGLEVSESNGIFDWSNTKPGFAFIHHGSGTAGNDSQFSRNASEAAKYGIPFGAIHTVKPDKSFKKQAEIISDLFGYPLPPVVLVAQSSGLTKQKLMDFLSKLFNHVFEAMDESQRPIIATNIGFWNASVARNDFAKKHLLMIYRWTNAADPGEPNDWKEINNPVRWTFWNYSRSAHGNLIRFNGDRDDFKRLFGVEAGENGETPPPVDPKFATTKFRANLRLAPEGQILAEIDPGIKFDIVGKKDDHYAVVVYLHENVVDVI